MNSKSECMKWRERVGWGWGWGRKVAEVQGTSFKGEEGPKGEESGG